MSKTSAAGEYHEHRTSTARQYNRTHKSKLHKKVQIARQGLLDHKVTPEMKTPHAVYASLPRCYHNWDPRDMRKAIT